MKLVFLVVAILSCVLAQAPSVPAPPQPCYISKVLTAEIFQVFFYQGANEQNTGTIYIDVPSQLLRFDVVAGFDNFGGVDTTYSVSIFENYNTNIGYVYDQSSKTCASVPITVPLGGGEIPSNSIYAGQILIGSQPVSEYVFGNAEYKIEVGITTGSCLLYNVGIYNTTISGQPNLVLTEAFWNVVPSVSPYIFDPPSVCTNNLVHFSQLSDETRRKALTAIHALDTRNLAFTV